MKKTSFFLIASILFSIFFTGCFSPVYYFIKNDVTPLDGTVNGTIRNITRYTVDGKEFLVVVSDKGLEYKSVNDLQHGAWKLYPDSALPIKEKHHYDYSNLSEHTGEQLLVTHADSDTLYLVSAEYKNDLDEGTSYPSKIHIYAKKMALAENGEWSSNGEWKSILEDGSGINYTPIYKDGSFYFSAFALFSSNSIQNAHRKVYLRTGNTEAFDKNYRAIKYYELSGLNSPVEISVTPVDSGEKNLNCANSAVYFNNQVMFFNSIAVTTNETATNDATVVYYGEQKRIYYKSINDSVFTECEFSTGQYPSTLCVCKDSLIIGRANYSSSSNSANGGVVKTSLNENGIPGKELVAFTTNIETQLQNSYFILTMINTNPSQTETESALYASVAFLGTGASSSAKFDEVGLWSYYKDRGNWNRE